MKIWITFNTVFSLQCGGLERCKIWFQKPMYVFVDKEFYYDSLPFGGGNQKQGLTSLGWRHSGTQGKEANSLSLGKIFNYEGDICELVWEKLCEFFESDDLRQWDVQEKKLKLNTKDFLLELDVEFKLL
jgi:hypothetical protein